MNRRYDSVNDLVGSHCQVIIDPLEITDPPPLPGGVIVRLYELDPPARREVCLLIRLDQPTRFTLFSGVKTIELRYVLAQLRVAWDTLRAELREPGGKQRFRCGLNGTSEGEEGATSRIEWSRFSVLAPGFVQFDAAWTTSPNLGE